MRHVDDDLVFRSTLSRAYKRVMNALFADNGDDFERETFFRFDKFGQTIHGLVNERPGYLGVYATFIHLDYLSVNGLLLAATEDRYSGVPLLDIMPDATKKLRLISINHMLRTIPKIDTSIINFPFISQNDSSINIDYMKPANPWKIISLYEEVVDILSYRYYTLNITEIKDRFFDWRINVRYRMTFLEEHIARKNTKLSHVTNFSGDRRTNFIAVPFYNVEISTMMVNNGLTIEDAFNLKINDGIFHRGNISFAGNFIEFNNCTFVDASIVATGNNYIFRNCLFVNSFFSRILTERITLDNCFFTDNHTLNVQPPVSTATFIDLKNPGGYGSLSVTSLATSIYDFADFNSFRNAIIDGCSHRISRKQRENLNEATSLDEICEVIAGSVTFLKAVKTEFPYLQIPSL